VHDLFTQYPDQIAGIIVEPIAANIGFVMPEPDFLPGLQSVCREQGALFIMDEVMTGFRVSPGGAQAAWGLDPDITTLGKVIGGGLPVGAYGGKRQIMETVAPAGPMYQAGTLSGNPLAMAAGLATVHVLLEPGVFDGIARMTTQLVEGIEVAANAADVPMQTGHAGTMFGFYFLKSAGVRVANYADAKQYADVERYGRFFHAMLEEGFYFAPSQFEAGFMSSAHNEQNIQVTIEACQKIFALL
jgi:glutamate-1-semialdehyde 2,1-aminomutase